MFFSDLATVEEGNRELCPAEKKVLQRRTVSASMLHRTISDQSSTSSCSPSEVERYNLRPTATRCNCLKMAPRCRAYWDNELTKTLLDLCITEKEKLNWHVKKGPTKAGWSNIHRNFRQLTGRAYDNRQLQNKFHSLKRLYRVRKKLKNASGTGRNNSTGTIIGDDDWWEARIAENEEAEELRDNPPAHEHEMSILFDGMTTEDGDMFCAGGYGDKTPSGGSDDNVGRSSVGRGQRSGKEQVVDSPPPKRTKSVEYYVERISETMLERSRNETSAMRQEQAKLVELLKVVELDGVPKNFELYFIATELLRSATCHAAFRRLDDQETRRSWLQWTWDNARKK